MFEACHSGGLPAITAGLYAGVQSFSTLRKSVRPFQAHVLCCAVVAERQCRRLLDVAGQGVSGPTWIAIRGGRCYESCPRSSSILKIVPVIQRIEGVRVVSRMQSGYIDEEGPAAETRVERSSHSAVPVVHQDSATQQGSAAAKEPRNPLRFCKVIDI